MIQVIGGHLDPAVDPGGLEDIDFKLVAGGGTNLRSVKVVEPSTLL